MSKNSFKTDVHLANSKYPKVIVGDKNDTDVLFILE